MEEKKESFPQAPLISASTIARVGIFSALGIVLGYISLFVPILGQQVKLDFSHLGTMLSAVFLGPFAGGNYRGNCWNSPISSIRELPHCPH